MDLGLPWIEARGLDLCAPEMSNHFWMWAAAGERANIPRDCENECVSLGGVLQHLYMWLRCGWCSKIFAFQGQEIQWNDAEDIGRVSRSPASEARGTFQLWKADPGHESGRHLSSVSLGARSRETISQEENRLLLGKFFLENRKNG